MFQIIQKVTKLSEQEELNQIQTGVTSRIFYVHASTHSVLPLDRQTDIYQINSSALSTGVREKLLMLQLRYLLLFLNSTPRLVLLPTM